MMKLSDIAKRMIWVICISLVVLIAASIVYYRSLMFLPFALGAFLGTSLNVFKVIMIDRIVKRAVDMETEKVGNYVTVQHFLRFLLTGIVLVLSAVLPFINLWGAAAGVLTFQIAAFDTKRFSDHGKNPNENIND